MRDVIVLTRCSRPAKVRRNTRRHLVALRLKEEADLDDTWRHDPPFPTRVRGRMDHDPLSVGAVARAARR